MMKISMQLLINLTLAVALSSFCLAEPEPNEPPQYSNIYVFGDSLSDIGNMNQLDPRAPQRFTNGRVAVEVTAELVGLPPLTPSFHLTPASATTPGNNYAVAGARSTDEDGDEATGDTNLPTQVNAFLQIVGGESGSVPSDALYVIGIGGNNVRDAQILRASAVMAPTEEERQATNQAARDLIRDAAYAEMLQIRKLVNAGARNIVVVGSPDVGASPEVDLAVQQAQYEVITAQPPPANERLMFKEAARLPRKTSKLSAKYNRVLLRNIRKLKKRSNKNNNNSSDGDLKILYFDLFAFTASLIDSAPGNGFTNTDDACIYIFSQDGAIHPECANDFPLATGFLFWDELHPSAAAHELVGRALANAVLEWS